MIYKEEVRDLFSVPDDYYFAQCISADFAMGKGIAVEFNKRFDMKNKLRKKYGDFTLYYELSELNLIAGKWCLLEDKVFNLVIKEFDYDKPTFGNIELALYNMKLLCDKHEIHKLAVPSTIGRGLDRLQWGGVSETIKIMKEVFAGSDIEILVCKKE